MEIKKVNKDQIKTKISHCDRKSGFSNFENRFFIASDKYLKRNDPLIMSEKVAIFFCF